MQFVRSKHARSSVSAVLTLVVSAGELLAQANTSYGLDTAPTSSDSATVDDKVPYGLDTVSSSGFHEGVWDRYGSDASPQVTTSEGHFRKTSPPQFPGLRDLPEGDLDHVALYRAIQQHLTGAVEVTPGPAQPAAKTSVKPTDKSANKSLPPAIKEPTKISPAPTRTYRRGRFFGR